MTPRTESAAGRERIPRDIVSAIITIFKFSLAVLEVDETIRTYAFQFSCAPEIRSVFDRFYGRS